MAYACTTCPTTDVPDLRDLAVRFGGVQWWRPRDLADVQAETLAHLIATGRCGRHAMLLAELVAMTVRDEFTRRHLPAIPPLPER